MTLRTRAQLTEKHERVDARSVTVTPGESKRVITDLCEIRQLQRFAGRHLDEANGALMPLTDRTRAVPAQDRMRVNRAVPVGEIDLECVGAARCAQLERGGAWC